MRRSNDLTNFLVRAKLRNPSQNNTPHLEVLFNVRFIVLRAPTNPKDLLLTNSAPQAKQEPLLTTLSATLKTLFTRFSDGLNVGVRLSVKTESLCR